MKILTAAQMREADAYTIEHEPVASIDLMERAAEKSRVALPYGRSYKIFCGLGNNGGDGLAIARGMSKRHADEIDVYIIRYSEKCSRDFIINEKRFKEFSFKRIHNIKNRNDFPELSERDVVVDAIFGTGLSRPPEGLAADVIRHINASKAEVISIDMPSGLFADAHTPNEVAVINASKILTFQAPKLSFFFPENGDRVGEVEILDIGLDFDDHLGILITTFSINTSVNRWISGECGSRG